MTPDLLTRLDEIVTLCCKADDDACETIREAQALIRGLELVWSKAAIYLAAHDEYVRKGYTMSGVDRTREELRAALAALDKKGE